ncbi:MAG: hypothetical protein WDM71_06160 [Ferruginibacter sp.]
MRLSATIGYSIGSCTTSGTASVTLSGPSGGSYSSTSGIGD